MRGQRNKSLGTRLATCITSDWYGLDIQTHTWYSDNHKFLFMQWGKSLTSEKGIEIQSVIYGSAFSRHLSVCVSPKEQGRLETTSDRSWCYVNDLTKQVAIGAHSELWNWFTKTVLVRLEGNLLCQMSFTSPVMVFYDVYNFPKEIDCQEMLCNKKLLQVVLSSPMVVASTDLVLLKTNK